MLVLERARKVQWVKKKMTNFTEGNCSRDERKGQMQEDMEREWTELHNSQAMKEGQG